MSNKGQPQSWLQHRQFISDAAARRRQWYVVGGAALLAIATVTILTPVSLGNAVQIIGGSTLSWLGVPLIDQFVPAPFPDIITTVSAVVSIFTTQVVAGVFAVVVVAITAVRRSS